MRDLLQSLDYLDLIYRAKDRRQAAVNTKHSVVNKLHEIDLFDYQ